MTVRPTNRASHRRRDPQQRRWSVVYGIPTLPVDSNGRVIPGEPPVVGYIGQSVQTVKQREAQHRATQPFGDIICGGAWVIEEGLWTQAELDARERYYIRHGAQLVPGQPAQRPIYNYEHNLDNPHRVEIWRAVEHRQTREPGWQPPPKDHVRIPRQRRAGVGRPARARRAAGWWQTHRWQVYGWAALWLLLCAGMWWAGADSWSGWQELRNAIVLGSCAWAVIAWRVWQARKPRRRRGRRR